MGRISTALGNFVAGFAIAFLLVSIVRNRQTAVKAGVVWGGVSAVLGVVLSDRLTPPEPPEEWTADDQDFEAPGTGN